MNCRFCNGEMKFIYKIENYDIIQCKRCYTARVLNMPSEGELKNFYSGYTFQCDENVKNLLTKDIFREWFKSFNLPKDALMLDIGGGGGGVFGFGAIFYIFNFTIKNIKIFLMFWIFICGYTYFNEVKNKSENEKYIFYYLSLVSFMLFGLSGWHPMWIIFINPFLVFGTVINKKYNIFMILDIFLMLFFTCYVVNIFPRYLDAHLLSNGVFNNILVKNNSSLPMKYIFKDNNWLAYTFFSGLLLLNALFKHPKYDFDNINEDISDAMPYIRLRLVIGMMIFIIPCFISALS